MSKTIETNIAEPHRVGRRSGDAWPKSSPEIAASATRFISCDRSGGPRIGRKRRQAREQVRRVKECRADVCRTSDEVFEITVRDHGDGFNVEEIPDPTDPENLLKTNGRGILFMRSFMDKVEWENAARRRTDRQNGQKRQKR